MSRSKVWCFLGIIVSGLALFFAAKRITITQKAYAQVRVQPFLLELEGVGFDNNGKSQPFLQKTVARRSDGTTAYIANIGPPGAGRKSRKIIAIGGLRTTLFDSITAKTSFGMGAGKVAWMKQMLEHPPANCINSEREVFVRNELYAGQSLNVINIDKSGQAGTDRVTESRSPALACEPVAWKVERMQPDGQYKTITVVKPVAMILAEPDERFFDPGQSYAELKPTEIYKRLRDAGQLPEDENTRKQMESLDLLYAGSKP